MTLRERLTQIIGGFVVYPGDGWANATHWMPLSAPPTQPETER